MVSTNTPQNICTFNGWRIALHPHFLVQLEVLIQDVQRKRQVEPEKFWQTNSAKRLAAVLRFIREAIPADPGNKQFRQGNTLGKHNKHWFRAKFFGQYRLFFQFNRTEKKIIIAWLNDEDSLRSYGDRNDAYATFARMLNEGNPPGNFLDLLREAEAATEQAEALLRAAETSLEPPPVDTPASKDG